MGDWAKEEGRRVEPSYVELWGDSSCLGLGELGKQGAWSEKGGWVWAKEEGRRVEPGCVGLWARGLKLSRPRETREARGLE